MFTDMVLQILQFEDTLIILGQAEQVKEITIKTKDNLGFSLNCLRKDGLLSLGSFECFFNIF